VLTERQEQIVKAIEELTDEYGYPPTVREVGRRVGLSSSSTVHTHLNNLARIEKVEWNPLSPRTLRVK
jgi:repressor LexA